MTTKFPSPIRDNTLSLVATKIMNRTAAQYFQRPYYVILPHHYKGYECNIHCGAVLCFSIKVGNRKNEDQHKEAKT